MTPEQIAALRAAAEKVHSKAHYAWDSIYPLNFYTPATVLELLDHLAKLEAERDAVLEEAALQAHASICIFATATAQVIGKRIRTLKSVPASAKEA